MATEVGATALPLRQRRQHRHRHREKKKILHDIEWHIYKLVYMAPKVHIGSHEYSHYMALLYTMYIVVFNEKYRFHEF